MSGRLRIIFAFVLLLAFSDAGAAVRGRNRRVQTDTVALECRGVMESFPKVEEGLEERLAFYRDKGLNHYFYCPSDDRYCNRWFNNLAFGGVQEGKVSLRRSMNNDN